MSMAIPDPPKVDSYGCFDIEEVLTFAKIVGNENAAKTLKIPLHRIIYFQSKKEGK